MIYKENITAILECYFTGFKKEIIDSACDRILEQDPFMNKSCVANQVCHEDKVKVLDKIKAEIEEQVLESLSDGGDDWFAAEKVNECLDIIDEYRK